MATGRILVVDDEKFFLELFRQILSDAGHAIRLGGAGAAMKPGCPEFLTKPVDRNELTEVAERVLSRVRLRREHSQLLSENLEFAKSQAIYRQGLQILAPLAGEKLQAPT